MSKQLPLPPEIRERRDDIGGPETPGGDPPHREVGATPKRVSAPGRGGMRIEVLRQRRGHDPAQHVATTARRETRVARGDGEARATTGGDDGRDTLQQHDRAGPLSGRRRGTPGVHVALRCEIGKEGSELARMGREAGKYRPGAAAGGRI